MKKLLLLTVIGLHLLLLSQLQYTAWPENLLWSYLNLHGLKFYQDIFYIYPPFYVLLLTNFYKIFSISLVSLLMFSYVIIALTDLGIWLYSKRIWPILVYIPLQIYFEGNGVWPDQLLAPLFIFSYLALQQKKYLLLGLLLGISLATKQTAGYFILGTFGLMIWQKVRLVKIGQVFFGLLSVMVIFLVWLISHNSLAPFFEEAFKYVLFYHAGNFLQTLWPTSSQFLIVLLVFIPGLVLGIRKKGAPLVILTVLASLGIFTRFSYFHLQPALPLLAVLLADFSLISAVPLLLFSLIFLKSAIRDFHQPPRFLGATDYQNAAKINQFVSLGEKTLILASQDHYYYLTNTLPIGNYFVSSTPWNLNYDSVQKKYVSYLKRYQPKYVFLGNCMWEKGICFKPDKVANYVRENYYSVTNLPDGTNVYRII